MATDIVHPGPYPSPQTALHISQQAPPLLAASKSYPYPLSLLLSGETQDQWSTIENLYISCLRTGDDESARQLLDQLLSRFGDKNERVMALQGMWAESRIENEADFVRVLKQYGEALEADPANMHLQKRRIALLRSMGRTAEALSQLISLVDVSPTDAEAWAELASVYAQQGMFDQAVFAMEEVLLIVPNAWTVSTRQDWQSESD
jgi:Flp pilus assembly protein TadD